MDSPIAPSAMRRAEDGPAYDLVSLGLVVLTILLVGVWTTHFFRQPVSDDRDYKTVIDAFERDTAGNLTSAGNLQAAQWIDFNLRAPDSYDIPVRFRDHLKLALALEQRENAFLGWRALHEDDEQSRNEAKMLLGEQDRDGGGPARLYAAKWYELRAAWIDARDGGSFNLRAHHDLEWLMRDLGMTAEAETEGAKIHRARPDQPMPPR